MIMQGTETRAGNTIRQRMDLAAFRELSDYVNRYFGIKMPDEKKIMIESRLLKRLRALNMANFSEYFNYVFSEEGQRLELVHMVDLITTNKTEFFRESGHFDFLRDTVYPELAARQQARPIQLWSAGCSSGEEVYTLSMGLEEFNARRTGTNLDYRILGTDLSTRILKMAGQAVYPEERVSGITTDMRKRYFLKSKDPAKKLVRVVPEIRNKASFRYLNFMETSYNVQEVFDIIFCRNVLIYFEREVQEEVIRKLCLNLRSGGYFFLGHSESIMRMDLPLKQIRPTIFRKT